MQRNSTGMTWRTHVAVGANVLWLTALTGVSNESMLVLLPVAMLSSLLPDIDSTGGAKIHYIGKGVLGGFQGLFRGRYFHHRGLMHSVFTTVLLYIILVILFHRYEPLLPIIAALAYFSHPLIDGFNAPVGYWFPFSLKKFALLPKPLRSPVGGGIDMALFIVASAGLLLFFILFSTQVFGQKQLF